MVNHYIEIFNRDLIKWKEEILAFKNEEDLWKIKGELKNSAGNLTLHIIGNLHHFIGANIGHTGYVRERDKEFSDKHISKEILVRNLDITNKMVKEILSELTDADLKKIFPLDTFGKDRNLHFILVQLVSHLNYHLGQVNSLRRIS